MKLFTGWMLSAGLVFAAAAANAQALQQYGIERSPYAVASDFVGPTGAVPPPEPPRYGQYLLPPAEVDSIVRESGFSPLGIPQLRGVVYTLSVLDRVGDDGRLVVDARTGRIISFMPASRLSDNLNLDLTDNYGPSGPPPRPAVGVPRPPAAVPHVLASRTMSVPLPTAPPRTGEAKPSPAAKPAPMRAQLSAARAKPVDTPATAVPAPAEAKPSVEPKPGAPLIRPTQPLPEVQGLD